MDATTQCTNDIHRVVHVNTIVRAYAKQCFWDGITIGFLLGVGVGVGGILWGITKRELDIVDILLPKLKDALRMS
jgi:hypothetical protein